MINISKLNYFEIDRRIEWIEKNVGPRKYYLHTARGGDGWTYNPKLRTITINDPQWELVYILTWGAQ